jgi:hypothetical protein
MPSFSKAEMEMIMENWRPTSRTGGNMIPWHISKSKFRKLKGIGKNSRNKLVQGDSQDGGSATWVSRWHFTQSNKSVKSGYSKLIRTLMNLVERACALTA